MQPFSPHTKFFSSLKQVEKRLKSEHTPTSPQPFSTKPTSSSSSSTDELSAPLYLYPCCDQSTNTNNDTQSSHPPSEFLSPSQDFHPPPPPPEVQEIENGENGIQEVLELLGLLEIGKEEGKSEMRNVRTGCCGGGGESFYSKIVGVKGPKSEKEMERLNGWIKYFLESKNGEGVMEPLRLVHLLIGKAVVASEEEGSSGGFGDIEFPSTVEEFLQHDPPT